MAVALLDEHDERQVTRAYLQGQVQDLQRRINALDTGPELPQPAEDGSVIRFRKYNQAYWFAAIRIGDYWFVTQDGARSSRQGHQPRDWEDLLEWIGERNFETVEVLS